MTTLAVGFNAFPATVVVYHTYLLPHCGGGHMSRGSLIFVWNAV